MDNAFLLTQPNPDLLAKSASVSRHSAIQRGVMVASSSQFGFPA